MRLKGLITDRRFRVMGVMVRNRCPAEFFLRIGPSHQAAHRRGLMVFLDRAADGGLSQFSSEIVHLVNQEEGIYEFIKGSLRLLFFKGEGRDLVICAGGYIKKGQKADPMEVAQAIRMKRDYLDARKSGFIQVVDDGENDGNA